MEDLQEKVRRTGYTFQDKLKKEYEKYFAVVAQQLLTAEEEKGFETFKAAFKQSQLLPFYEQLTHLITT